MAKIYRCRQRHAKNCFWVESSYRSFLGWFWMKRLWKTMFSSRSQIWAKQHEVVAKRNAWQKALKELLEMEVLCKEQEDSLTQDEANKGYSHEYEMTEKEMKGFMKFKDAHEFTGNVYEGIDSRFLASLKKSTRHSSVVGGQGTNSSGKDSRRKGVKQSSRKRNPGEYDPSNSGTTTAYTTGGEKVDNDISLKNAIIVHEGVEVDSVVGLRENKQQNQNNQNKKNRNNNGNNQKNN